jgi:hypothetical protein
MMMNSVAEYQTKPDYTILCTFVQSRDNGLTWRSRAPWTSAFSANPRLLDKAESCARKDQDRTKWLLNSGNEKKTLLLTNDWCAFLSTDFGVSWMGVPWAVELLVRGKGVSPIA